MSLDRLDEPLTGAVLADAQEWLVSHDPEIIAEEMTRLPPVEQAVAFRLLDRERAAAVFDQLDSFHQQVVLDGLRDGSFTELLEQMAPDNRARLVGELPAGVAKRVLAGLSPEERRMTAPLLGYPPESAGRLMTPEFVSLRESMQVADALAKARRDGAEAETVYMLPVTDDQRHLEGVVSLRDLVLADPDTTVGSIMATDVVAATVTDDQEAAARRVQAGEHVALPVVDSENRLVGILSFDDAMRILEAENTEDQALLAASSPLKRPFLAASVLGVARSRALWLLLLIVAASLTVNVLSAFEDTLAQVVTLSMFIPLLIGTGGNSGSQAATVVTRALAVDEVRVRDLPRVVWREVRVGFLLGAMLSVVGFFPVWLFFDIDIAIVISVTLLAICTWATVVGSSLPLLADRVGIDPAVVSAPLVSTLVDATGLVIYLTVAKLVLGL